jgi:transporter family protein
VRRWGYFKKNELHLGNLSLQKGITNRMVVVLIFLGIVCLAHWNTIPHAGTKVFQYMDIWGGWVGAVGMLSFYYSIKEASLNQVMNIAFTSPLFGALMGIIFSGEPLTAQATFSILLTVGGIVLLTAG